LKCIARIAGDGAAIVAVAALCACGTDRPDRPAVSVGDAGITSGTVEHWMAAMAGGQIPSDQARRRVLRAQALDFLISAHWLLGEAAADGMKLSAQEVERRFEQKKRASFPGGPTELRAFLKATGQPLSDIKFEAQVELASEKIRQQLEGRQPAVGQAQVAAYYRQHRQQFTTPERRYVQLTDRQSRSEAQMVKRKLVAERSSDPKVELTRQWVELPPVAYAGRGGDATLSRAIHFARLRVWTGPVLVHGIDYYILDVMRVTSARQSPLAQVEGTIKRQLTAERQRRALVAFVASWRRRWIARTDCRAGYVVQKCRGFHGTRTSEDPAQLS
jgi:foldase protein PrsA